MKRTTVGVRLALLSIAVVAMLVAVPATAFAAKATTRFVVASSSTVNHDTATENLWPVTVTAKLQKRSGGRYVALKGATVKVYRYDPATKKYVALPSRKSSSSGSVSVSVPMRGKYKLVYAGSTSNKSCTGYTTVYESIGASLSYPSISLDWVEGTTTFYMTVQYDVAWNTAAWDDSLAVCYEGYLYWDGRYSCWVDYDRELFAPGPVEFKYKVDQSELLYTLRTTNSTFAFDPYIVTPEPFYYLWDLPAY